MKEFINEAELEKNLNEAKASLAIENLYLTKNEDELVKARLRGDISHEEFIKRASEKCWI
jgi:hypothetical protein